jgi:hypothetical protein
VIPWAPAVAIISYDEKPGIQTLATTAPDLSPEPMRHQTIARDHEHVRLGTLSVLAGIRASVIAKDRRRNLP